MSSINTNSLRLAFDARMVYYRQAGIGQYIMRLLAAMAALPRDEVGDLHVDVLQSRKQPQPIITGDPRFRRVALLTPPHHAREQLGLAAELLRLRPKPDVLHSPDFIPPFRRPCPAVITVHDLAFLRFPELLTAESAAYYGQIRRAVASAEAIIAVSQATAADLQTLAGANPARVRVIYEAADPIFKPPAQSPQHDDGGYILFVGTLEPRKNLGTLLAAYRLLLDGGRVKPLPRLFIAGEKGWLYDDIARTVTQLGLDERVRFLGRVATDELPGLYGDARAFVMPSLYEGFGLPVLEALACASPVIVSDAGSLPEITGDAGLLAAPQDPTAWAAALERLLLDDALAARLRHAGPQRAARFSWQRAARETLALYRDVKRL